MAKLKITLSIAGQSYPVSVDSDKEELYREAAKRLNAKIKELTQVPSFNLSDCVAMAAFKFSIMALSAERMVELDNADVDSLNSISERIDEYMSRS